MRRLLLVASLLVGVAVGCVLGTEDVGTAQSQSCECDCEPGNGFGLGTFEVPNTEAPHNWTMSLGWNSNEAGNPIVQGEPVLYDTWESNWLTSGARWMERHWQYRGADGTTTRRPLTMVIDRDTHAPQVHVGGKFVVSNATHSATRVNVLDAPSGQASVMLMGSPAAATPIRCDHNGSACIQQRGPTGATVHLVNADTLGRVVIGGAGAQGLRFYSANKPTVADVDDVITALAELGLVVDGR